MFANDYNSDINNLGNHYMDQVDLADFFEELKQKGYSHEEIADVLSDVYTSI